MSGKTVAVLGSGGREHAMVAKLLESPQVEKVWAVPGNDGMKIGSENAGKNDDKNAGGDAAQNHDKNDGGGKTLARWIDVDLSSTEGFDALADWALAQKVDLVVVGPDNPLADGVVDRLTAKGVLVFGPSADAAKIEASKSFAKEIMDCAGVPTARFKNFDSLEGALEFVQSWPWPMGMAIKADGLALGKGVVVCPHKEPAIESVRRLFPLNESLVVEERLTGEELSWMAFCDGETFRMLEPARDYKPLSDGNKGPNTGGMGAYSPVREVLTDEWRERVAQEVFAPTLKELVKRGIHFRGMLYAGLMVDLGSCKMDVLEYNARFGDPEAQILLSRLDEDFYEWCEAVAQGDLQRLDRDPKFLNEDHIVVVAASPRYPESSTKGISIAKHADANDVIYAGVKSVDGLAGEAVDGPGAEAAAGTDDGAAATTDIKLQTNGGRVLGFMGRGKTLDEAREDAYAKVEIFGFEGMQVRQDIGRRIVE